MVLGNRFVAFLIILMAIFYCYNAYMSPIRADEAYLYLKGVGASWTNFANIGIIEYIIKFIDFIGSSTLQLRMPSILFLSLSALIIYQLSIRIFGEISSIKGAMIGLLIFFFLPSVTYSYLSLTPNGIFTFFTAIYLYAFYEIAFNNNKSIFYYILSAISIICAISIDFSGIILLINHIAFYFINKDNFRNSKYNLATIISIIALILLEILNYFNLFDLFYKYPVSYNNPLLYKIILIFIIYLPFLFVVLSRFIKKIEDSKIFPLFTSAIIFSLGGLFFLIIKDYDVRYLSAMMLPSILLFAYFYDMYKSKFIIGMIIIILAGVSVYSNMFNKSLLTPSYMASTKIYEAIKYSLDDIIEAGDYIFSDTKELSSIISYNQDIPYPKACVIDKCEGNSGIFVSLTARDDLGKYFNEVQESSIYRHRSIKDGEIQLYFYRVSR